MSSPTPCPGLAPGESIEPYLSERQISERVRELAAELRRHYEGERPVFVSMLKGSVFFLCDLCRAADLDLELYFLQFSSYGRSTRPEGPVTVYELPLPDVRNRPVVLVEDILDTGQTLSKAVELFQARGCASLKICVLLAKEGYENGPVPHPDYVGFVIPDEFVVGYGLDYQERFRHLSEIGILHLGEVETNTDREGM